MVRSGRVGSAMSKCQKQSMSKNQTYMVLYGNSLPTCVSVLFFGLLVCCWIVVITTVVAAAAVAVLRFQCRSGVAVANLYCLLVQGKYSMHRGSL